MNDKELYANATSDLKEGIKRINKIEELVGIKLDVENFALCPEKVIKQLNQLVLITLPENDEKLRQQEAAAKDIVRTLKNFEVLALINQSWVSSRVRSETDPESLNNPLNPQKTAKRNYEVDLRDEVLHYKEEEIKFLRLYTEEFNRLDLDQRRILIYKYHHNLTETVIEKKFNISTSTVRRLKKAAIIQLDENIQTASYLQGAFNLRKKEGKKKQ